MKTYVTHLFAYNDWAHCRILEGVSALANPEEALSLFTHVILSQRRWLERVQGASTVGKPWFGPAFSLEQCQREWAASLQEWLAFLAAADEADLDRVFRYETSEGPPYQSSVREVVVQLTNHSVHHRAQIARMIRQQGHTPPETDYIFFSRRPA